MALRFICECGNVVKGHDEDELWRNAQGHIAVMHPDQAGKVTRQDVIALADDF